jgi:phosphoglucomutase
MLATNNEPTPTPAISHAILTHNRGRDSGFADGIVVTPSHNPPDSGGFKYNPRDGGPAGEDVTGWIEARANALLEAGLEGVARAPHAKALRAPTTQRHDYIEAYVADLGSVIDLELIRDSKVRMGVDPLGGAGVHYWARIAERYRLDLSVVSDVVDATFRFMSLDWDGRIRMDPSSPYAMQRLLDLKDRFDIAFACDTDHDRHGIVTAGAGLLPSNHYLAAMVDYLFQHRPQWRPATREQKKRLAAIMPARIDASELAGERITQVLSDAPGNGAPLSGIKVIAEGGWFAARPSGTEDIYKIYAESFLGEEHLERILDEAGQVVDAALASAG